MAGMQDPVAVCKKLEQKISESIRNAKLLFSHWRSDIENQRNEDKDVLGDGQLIYPPFAVFQKLIQEIPECVERELGVVLAVLQLHVASWKTQQLYDSVCRRSQQPFENSVGFINDMCAEVWRCVGNLLKLLADQGLQQLDLLSRPKQGLHAIPPLTTPTPTFPTPSTINSLTTVLEQAIQRLVTVCFVVTEQPDRTLKIDKEKSGKENSAGTSKGKARKDAEETHSVKPFSITVGLLGGEKFQEVEFQGLDMYLAYKPDLSLAPHCRPTQCFPIDRPENGTSKAKPKSKRVDHQPGDRHQLVFKGLNVKGFSRKFKETRMVHEQFYHVVVETKIRFPQLLRPFSARVMSLPMLLHTGANQASEHTGVLLWHSFASPNVYDLERDMMTSMTVEDVIEMLNERILYIGGRGLKPYEREFLHEKLTVAARTSKKTSARASISLDAFIKDGVTLPPHEQSGVVSEKEVDFSLWAWVHSIVNLLSETLPKQWLAGLIHGFVSRQQCVRLLGDRRVDNGTFLLRFSESFHHGNHANMEGGLCIVLKWEGKVAFAPPMKAEDLKTKGLGQSIQAMGMKRCERLLDTDLTTEDLIERYPPSPTKNGKVVGARYFPFFINSPSEAGSSNSEPQSRCPRGNDSVSSDATLSPSNPICSPPSTPASPRRILTARRPAGTNKRQGAQDQQLHGKHPRCTPTTVAPTGSDATNSANIAGGNIPFVVDVDHAMASPSQSPSNADRGMMSPSLLLSDDSTSQPLTGGSIAFEVDVDHTMASPSQSPSSAAHGMMSPFLFPTDDGTRRPLTSVLMGQGDPYLQSTSSDASNIVQLEWGNANGDVITVAPEFLERCLLAVNSIEL